MSSVIAATYQEWLLREITQWMHGLNVRGIERGGTALSNSPNRYFLMSREALVFPNPVWKSICWILDPMMPLDIFLWVTFSSPSTRGWFPSNLWTPQRDTWGSPCRMAIHLFMPFVGEQFPFWGIAHGQACQGLSRDVPGTLDTEEVRKYEESYCYEYQ
jgi:hypothetical protein